MCTAISFGEGLFGRTMDYEISFGERVLAVPRGIFPIGESRNRYSIIGIGIEDEKSGTPLYFDGMNEWGLSAAALNFPGLAVYHKGGTEGRNTADGRLDVPAGVLISYILGLCRDVEEARTALSNIDVTDTPSANNMPAPPLHWIISDARASITVESVSDGLKIYDNQVGVLTNGPEFPYHMTRLADYMHISPDRPKNRFAKTELSAYSRGMGAIGLPGDFSSSTRFVRACFVNEHTRAAKKGSARERVVRAFHVLSSVSVPLGCIISDEGHPVSTLYTSVADAETLTYYFTTYSCPSIRAVRLNDSLLNGEMIRSFELCSDANIQALN